jgi:hypothetical protein
MPAFGTARRIFAASHHRYDVRDVDAQALMPDPYSHACAAFLGLVGPAIGFWPSG